jgi:hypothetical protein
MLTITCLYTENKSCLNEYAEIFFSDIGKIIVIVTYLLFQYKMTAFNTSIFILANSESHTVSQKLPHKYVYLSVTFYKYSYTTQNGEHF